MSFQRGDLVWVRIQSYPLWPCKIIKKVKAEGKLFWDVKFLGENSTAVIVEEDVQAFDAAMPEYTPAPEVLRKHKKLGKGLKEVADLIKMASNNQKDSPEKPPQTEVRLRRVERLNIRRGKNKVSKESASKTKENPIVVSDSEQRNRLSKIPQPMPTGLNRQKEVLDEQRPSISLPQRPTKSLDCSESTVQDTKRQTQDVQKKAGLQQINERSPIQQHPSQKQTHEPIQTQLPICLNKKQRLQKKRRLKHENKYTHINKTTSQATEMVREISPATAATHVLTTQDTPEWTLVKKINNHLHMIDLLIHAAKPDDKLIQSKLQEFQSMFKGNKLTARHYITSNILSHSSFVALRLPQGFEQYREWIKKNLVEDVNTLIFKHFNDYSLYERVYQAKMDFPSDRTSVSVKPQPILLKKEESQDQLDDQSSKSLNKPSQMLQCLKANLLRDIRLKTVDIVKSKVKKVSQLDVEQVVRKVVDFLSTKKDRVAKWESIRRRLESRRYKDKEECLDSLDKYLIYM